MTSYFLIIEVVLLHMYKSEGFYYVFPSNFPLPFSYEFTLNKEFPSVWCVCFPLSPSHFLHLTSILPETPFSSLPSELFLRESMALQHLS